ncbi:MAG: S-layer homology domain-containing protein [Clostridia bacterium]|nr:S-layer homology domain-containing protein [Clostridia bacterium]
MKSKLSKIIAAVLSLALTVSGLPAVSFAETAEAVISASYDMTVNNLAVDISSSSKGKKMVYVIAAPTDITDYRPETLSADNRVVMRTFSTDENGALSFNFVMPEDFNGRYNVTVNADVSEKTFIIADITALEAVRLHTAFSSGDYSASAGIENPLTTTDEKADIAAYVQKNASLLMADNPMSAINVYMSGESAAYVMSGRLTLGEALDLYKDYMEMYSGSATYAQDFAELAPDVQAKLEEYFKKTGTDDSFDKVYDMCRFMAQYICASSDAVTKELALPRLMESHPDLYEEYKDIGNKVYQYAVFSGMYADRSTVSDYESVAASFEKHIEIQKERLDDDTSDDTSSGGGGGGSRGGSSGVTSGNIGLTPAQSVVQAVFSDIEGHWAKTNIENMYTKGIINGFSDGTFKPEQNVTRAEFAKMLSVMLALDTSGDADFADVVPGSWYNGYVAAAAKAGIVKGSEGNFNPELYITRQDAAVMLARVLTYRGISFGSTSAGFNDEAKIADYALDSVNGMSGLGIITGYNGGFAPLDNTTRAQAAALLERVVNIIG